MFKENKIKGGIIDSIFFYLEENDDIFDIFSIEFMKMKIKLLSKLFKFKIFI